ncbi:hypothetical protein [Massilia sp.]|uniref:hypothetical protein n=1 Tax=Massilia sp. TaxID=1882437 RepID=UPI0028AAC5CE|nr:hypothetical protein [Massilia sp.]
MAREEFLDELSDDFPCQRIYSYDESFRYETERRAIMDAVLDGTFEKYECAVKESEFSYKITADAVFSLEVKYKEDSWKKDFKYVAEAFDIGEAAYRFFIVVPRVLDEGEVLLAAERGLAVDQESRGKHDHCEQIQELEEIKVITPPHYRTKGRFLVSTVFLCKDGRYAVSVIHLQPGARRFALLDAVYTDVGFAELIAVGYVTHFDLETCPGPFDEVYQEVYRRVTH